MNFDRTSTTRPGGIRRIQEIQLGEFIKELAKRNSLNLSVPQLRQLKDELYKIKASLYTNHDISLEHKKKFDKEYDV